MLELLWYVLGSVATFAAIMLVVMGAVGLLQGAIDHERADLEPGDADLTEYGIREVDDP